MRLGEGVELGAEDRARAVIGDRSGRARGRTPARRPTGWRGCSPGAPSPPRARHGSIRRTRRASSSWRGHRVERLGEHAELVAAGDRRLAREVAARHRLRRLREVGERLGKQVRLRGRHRHGDEQRHQQREAQRDDVDALEPVARDRELAVVAVGGFDRLGAARRTAAARYCAAAGSALRPPARARRAAARRAARAGVPATRIDRGVAAAWRAPGAAARGRAARAPGA